MTTRPQEATGVVSAVSAPCKEVGRGEKKRDKSCLSECN
jgi:hypothetical protein